MQQATLTDEKLDALQKVTCDYYFHETNPANGLVADKTQKGSPASIAAVGLALSAYPGVVEHGGIPRAEAARRALTSLRFFWNSPQGPEPERSIPSWWDRRWCSLPRRSRQVRWGCRTASRSPQRVGPAP